MATAIPRCTRLAITTGPPPTIVVEYDCCANSPKSTPAEEPNARIDHRRKTIRLHNLADSMDSAEAMAHRLGRKFPRHLGPKVVQHAQLQGLILKLQRLVKAGSTTPCATSVSRTRSAASGEPEQVAVKNQDQGRDQEEQEQQQDLNRASENELAAAKVRMDVVFKLNLLKPGSPGYVHDVRKDFDQPEEDCDWDEDEDSS